mmetsp:Transcript_39002/g.96892  ORF Transcript_39002/g.96892 Transcript_39002/m.96892 type:complete len:143 (-) Transcript_39002:330-758(-)
MRILQDIKLRAKAMKRRRLLYECRAECRGVEDGEASYRPMSCRFLMLQFMPRRTCHHERRPLPSKSTEYKLDKCKWLGKRIHTHRKFPVFNCGISSLEGASYFLNKYASVARNPQCSAEYVVEDSLHFGCFPQIKSPTANSR